MKICIIGGGGNSAQMAQAGGVGEAIKHLRDADFIAVVVFNTEVAGCEGAVNAVFNGGGFDDFVEIGQGDNVFVVVGGSPRAGVDLFFDLFFHIFDHFVEIVAKLVV